MGRWTKVVEADQIFFINEEIGNILETLDGKFLATIPKIVRLGPFDTLEAAKQSAEDREGLNKTIDTYNLHLISSITEPKSTSK